MAVPENNTKSTHCQVCRREFSRDLYILKDSPQNSDVPSECNCWLCIECWQEMHDEQRDNCPICAVDVSEWLYSHYASDSDEN